MKIRNLYTLSTCVLTTIILFFSDSVHAQADRTLTMTDFLNFTPSASNADNISNVPLAKTAKAPNYQWKAGLDTNGRILYCPDGMDNFGPYTDSASQFNLFNFTHWQYIDILAWFGGSASTPILIPSKSWVDAAHKNGVKVIGTIFFAPTVYGGSLAQVQQFLTKDVSGNFIASQKLQDIANYYHFDGWIFNAETSISTSPATAAMFVDFINKFDSAYAGECIWYDSMLSNGSVNYQNVLNSNNAYFFQHSTGIFTNYNWSSNTQVTSSATKATSLGRSPFDVYMGADMWPSRTAQPAFTNYTWIDRIYQGGIAKTSTAMFAMNFTFNYSGFSIFNTDPTDYDSFYNTEYKIFSGLDMDPFTVDATWKGLGNYSAVRTPILRLPFNTDFNTGHGLNYYSFGAIQAAGPWHNMAHQSYPPSWTFFKNGVDMSYNFTNAWEGGSSLQINAAAAGDFNIPLYSTCIPVNATTLNATIATFIDNTSAIDSANVELVMKNAQVISAAFHPTTNFNWQSMTLSNVIVPSADTIIAIRFHIHANAAFNMSLGNLAIQDPNATGIQQQENQISDLVVYPNPSYGPIHLLNKSTYSGQLRVFDLQGKQVVSRTLQANENVSLKMDTASVYIYEFMVNGKLQQGKFIVAKP